MEDKPHECDWLKAPIGNKECHYEVRVILVIRHSDGTRSISDDGGETWAVDTYDLEPSMHVVWQKVDE